MAARIEISGYHTGFWINVGMIIVNFHQKLLESENHRLAESDLFTIVNDQYHTALEIGKHIDLTGKPVRLMPGLVLTIDPHTYAIMIDQTSQNDQTRRARKILDNVIAEFKRETS